MPAPALPLQQPDRASVAPDTVRDWLHAGRTLDDVERELLAPAALSEEQRAALWLYAWSLQDRPGRRGPQPLGCLSPGTD